MGQRNLRQLCRANGCDWLGPHPSRRKATSSNALFIIGRICLDWSPLVSYRSFYSATGHGFFLLLVSALECRGHSQSCTPARSCGLIRSRSPEQEQWAPRSREAEREGKGRRGRGAAGSMATNGSSEFSDGVPVPPGMENVYLCTLSVVPAAMKTLVDLDVFNVLGKAGPGAFLSASELTAHIEGGVSTTTEQVGRILRLLTAHNLFTESVTEKDGEVERKYALNRVSALLVDRPGVKSLAAGIKCNMHPDFLRTHEFLTPAVLQGVDAFTLAHGIDTWSYVAKNTEVGALFNNMMSGGANIITKRVLEIYDGFKDTKVLVDVGGGVGTTISLIKEKYPHIRAINFDLPHTVASAPAYEGVEHVGGDALKEVPSGDTIFMKKVLHDWSDEHSLTILKNIYKALPVGGKVVFVDTLLPQETGQGIDMKTPLQVDIHMLTYNVGGKERTEHEFRKLVTSAGFSRFQVAVVRDAMTAVMEGFKD